MKKATRLFAFLLAAVMLWAVIPFSASASNLSGMKIVAFGDSLTHFGATDSGETDANENKIYTDAYPDYLSDELGVEVVNAGVGGNTTDMAIDRLNGEVIAEDPDIVLICLGMNDQAYNPDYGTYFTPIECYRNNLIKFVEDITKAGGDVVFVTPNPICVPHFTYWGGYNYNYGSIVDYCNVMREIALEYNCGLVDIYREFEAIGDITPYMALNDGVHQNDAGRQLFAELISEYLYAAYDGTNKAEMTICCKDESGRIINEYTISGAAGANITVASPDIGGYTAVSSDINTTFVNGATHYFTYSSDLEAVIEKAGQTVAKDYNRMIALNLQNAYNKAMNLIFAATPNFDAMEEQYSYMESLIAAKGDSELIVSEGASYYSTTPNYTNWKTGILNRTYADDGIRLTDGLKNGTTGECSYYAAWVSDVEVIIDFGEMTEMDVFRAYFASDEWGVANPKTMSVSYFSSDYTWVDVSGTVAVKNIVDGSDADPENTDGIWSRDEVSVTLDAPVIGSKVRFRIPRIGNFIWMSEVEVALKVSPDADSLYCITGINSPVDADDTHIFTPGFTITGESANLNYTSNILAVWDSDKDAYIITDVFYNDGVTKTMTLNEGEIVIAAHYWTEAGMANHDLIATAQKGQAVYLNGVDVDNGVAICATFEISDYKENTDLDPGERPDSGNGNNTDKNENNGSNENISSGDDYVIGDINDNGTVDMTDYILAKRAYFGTYTLNEGELKRGDVNKSGNMDMTDYILIKRVYFGTYSFE